MGFYIVRFYLLKCVLILVNNFKQCTTTDNNCIVSNSYINVMQWWFNSHWNLTYLTFWKLIDTPLSVQTSLINATSEIETEMNPSSCCPGKWPLLFMLILWFLIKPLMSLGCDPVSCMMMGGGYLVNCCRWGDEEHSDNDGCTGWDFCH